MPSLMFSIQPTELNDLGAANPAWAVVVVAQANAPFLFAATRLTMAAATIKPELGQISAHLSGVDAVEGVVEVVAREVCDAVNAKDGSDHRSHTVLARKLQELLR
jgi:hypothetical protein